MNTVTIDKSLLQYVIAYLNTDHSQTSKEEFDSTWGEGIKNAIPALLATLNGVNVPPVEQPGYKQIPGDTSRTETGMGPILTTNSQFI